MAYVLRTLILISTLGIITTMLIALKFIEFDMNHITLALPTFLLTIFSQSLVMFYFIGIKKFVNNIHLIINDNKNPSDIFENEQPLEVIEKYRKTTIHFLKSADLSKRKVIPWTILIIILGMLAFFLGAAHDNNMVSRHIHSGVVYGFIVAMTIGFYKEWKHLGMNRILLVKVRATFKL